MFFYKLIFIKNHKINFSCKIYRYHNIEILQLKVDDRYRNEALEFLVSSMKLITLNELRGQLVSGIYLNVSFLLYKAVFYNKSII